MKKTSLIFITLLVISCQKETKKPLYPTANTTQSAQQIGQEIFEGKGMCYTCHLPNNKSVGPSISEIAQVYKKQKASMANFLQEKSQPIVDPAQYPTMQANLTITKNMPIEEVIALEKYMLTFAEK